MKKKIEVILELVAQENAVMQDEAREQEDWRAKSEAKPRKWSTTELLIPETAEALEEVIVDQLSETDELCQSLNEPKPVIYFLIVLV